MKTSCPQIMRQARYGAMTMEDDNTSDPRAAEESRRREEFGQYQARAEQEREERTRQGKVVLERALAAHPDDPVRKYCQQRGYGSHVIIGGLEGMLERWEHAIAIVSNPASADYMLEEYQNNLDGRRILEESLGVATEQQLQSTLPRLSVLDERFLAVVEITDECMWGAAVAERRGYTRDKQWWYFAHPLYIGRDWRH